MQLMNDELRNRRLQAGIASLHPFTRVNFALAKTLEDERNRAKATLAQADLSAKSVDAAITAARHATSGLAEPRPVAVRSIQTSQVYAPGISMPRPTFEMSDAQKEMTAQLAAAKQHVGMPPQMAARVNTPDVALPPAVRNLSQPATDIVLTSMRRVSPVSVPATAAPAGQISGASDTIISWDEWHARFAQLARQPVLSAIARYGNPAGKNTVSIKVTRDHRVAVGLTKSGDARFDQAMLEAYRALDGDPRLEFPSGSKRQLVSFEIDNEHKGTLAPSTVQSTAAVGDKELVGYPVAH
jgi:hypothetical protein